MRFLNKPLHLVVDFDETIAMNTTADDTAQLFKHAYPNMKLIEKLQQYYVAGAKITIHTARGMLSCNNDVAQARLKYEDLIIEWLNTYNVPYDELIFGKPYGDYYIDDKAITPEDFIKRNL